MRACLIVEVAPRADNAFGVQPVAELVEVHDLVLQRPPQPLDEDVVQKTGPIRLTLAAAARFRLVSGVTPECPSGPSPEEGPPR